MQIYFSVNVRGKLGTKSQSHREYEHILHKYPTRHIMHFSQNDSKKVLSATSKGVQNLFLKLDLARHVDVYIFSTLKPSRDKI